MSHASSRLIRSMSLAAIALVVAGLLAACGPTGASPAPSTAPSASSGPSPTPAPSASPVTSPSAAVGTPIPSSDGAVGACTSNELEVVAGEWGGAAGSRGADITVANRGQAPCVLPLEPVVAAVDSGGTVILQNRPALGANGPTLAPGATTTFSMVLSNWCDQAVGLPVAFRLVLASEAADVAELSIATADELPPCNGPDQPASMSTTAWTNGG